MDQKDASADAQALIASTRAQPRWEKWSNVPKAAVEELVLLSLGIDPDVWRDDMTPREQHLLAYAVGLNQKLDLAVRSLSSEGPLRPTPEGARGKKARVDAAVFVTWAQTLNPPWLLPPEFPTGGTASIVRGIESLNAPHHPYYAEELAIACRVWLALYSEGHEKAGKLNKGDRERFARDDGAGSLAAERIATIITPFSRKSGGVSKTPVKKTDPT